MNEHDPGGRWHNLVTVLLIGAMVLSVASAAQTGTLSPFVGFITTFVLLLRHKHKI